MKKTWLKVCALMLAVLTVLPIIASCGNNTDATSTSGSTQPTRKIDDSILDGLKFNGDTVNFAYQLPDGDTTYAPLSVESLTNDALNDQIYNRELRVEERLNVKINFIPFIEEARSTISTSILSGLDDYQIVSGDARDTVQNFYYNLLDKTYNKYMNITGAEYWSTLYTEQQTMYGQCYLCSGPITLAYAKSTFCVFFNKTLVEEYKLGNIYDIVKSGSWTLENMISLVKGTYVDVTGDGKTEDDVFGLSFDDARVIDAFWSAFDLTCVSRDTDNNPVLDINIDKMNNVCDAIRSLERDYRDIWCYDTLTLYNQGIAAEDLNIEKFANDEAVFWLANVYMCDRPTMRNMKSEYGVIPLPKWDSSQEDYYSYCLMPEYAIPTTNRNPDIASAVLEALASDSYRYVAPAYYNKVLKGRYMSDLESSEMLDMLMNNVKLDFGWIYDWALSKICQESLRYFIRESDNSFSTYWRQNKKRYTKAFDELVTKYQDMAEENNY